VSLLLKWLHANVLKWEALNAVSAFVLASIALYFSDLPTQIAELTTTNRKLSDQAFQTQIQASRAIIQSLDAQAEINRSVQVALSAQQRVQDLADKAHKMETEINRLVQVSLSAQQRVQDLGDKTRKMETEVDSLTAQKQALAAQKAQITSDLQAANQILVKTVDASVNMMYSRRFADLLSQMQNANTILIPTLPTEADATSAKFGMLGFVFIDKHFNAVNPAEIASGQIYDAGALAVMAIEQVSAVADGRGSSVTVRAIPVDDERFKKFILLLKSQFTIDLATLLSLKQRLDIDPPKPGPIIRVIDVLSKIAAGKRAFAIGFLPGSSGDVSYEDFKIRGFWFTRVVNALALAGGSGDQLKEKMKEFDLSGDIMGVGLSMQFSQKELDETMVRIEAVFGKIGFAHARDRLKILDDAWLKELHAEPLRWGKEPVFRFDSDDHLRNIYQRWNWKDDLGQQSIVLFDSIVTDERLNFPLMCSAARFLDNNNVSRGPDVLSSLRSCKETLAAQDGLDEFLSKHRPGVSD